jgi:hypothetical protein
MVSRASSAGPAAKVRTFGCGEAPAGWVISDCGDLAEAGHRVFLHFGNARHPGLVVWRDGHFYELRFGTAYELSR